MPLRRRIGGILTYPCSSVRPFAPLQFWSYSFNILHDVYTHHGSVHVHRILILHYVWCSIILNLYTDSTFNFSFLIRKYKGITCGEMGIILSRISTVVFLQSIFILNRLFTWAGKPSWLLIDTKWNAGIIIMVPDWHKYSGSHRIIVISYHNHRIFWN
jgi:hypothetical protein